MGFVDLVMFAVKYFDILAWSLLALVYPLWASTRAIEADDESSSDCKKLVAYWVLFSLIFLFEQGFSLPTSMSTILALHEAGNHMLVGDTQLRWCFVCI
ncbi:hypothetical protein Dsin_032493 [Dipteronia sinensis]|uniref:HVA22-like protein n=1 Tax=Dipteronia sinensis TaxID=43782 RepID=A0AAE0DTE6_9ROSI|nr:hypothetical protein Dsin_032493 [Dipteronia sinensis]